MSLAPETPNLAAKTVAVLDVELEGQRRLVETLGGAGLEPLAVADLDALADALRDGKSPVALIAFEALWPEPQVKLRALREAAPSARLMVAYSDVPRERLGQRLWSIGLIDYFFPRASPPHELASMLRQAIADALMEEMDGLRLDPKAPGAALLGFRFLVEVGAAFANQSSVEGILRELHLKLSRFVEYSALQVMRIDAESPHARVHTFQTRPVRHETVWRLSEAICGASAPYLDEPLDPSELAYVDDAPPTLFNDAAHGDADPEPPVPSGDPLVLRLIHCGELVGCAALMPMGVVTNEQRQCLRVLASQLAMAVRSAQNIKLAETTSLIDELTSAHNRRYLSRVLPAEWRRARRYKLQLTVAMIDIDWFKRLNDQWGHLVGDSALRSLAMHIRENLRDTDHIVRYGGEEFLLILPETDLGEAALVVERLRMLVANQPILTADGKTVQITFSAGIAGTPGCRADTAEQLLELADQALLIAKRTGKNRVCVAHVQDAAAQMLESEHADKRRFPRVPAELQLSYVPLPDFAVRSIAMRATNFSAGGVGVSGQASLLKNNSYALVYFEHGEGPVLSQVVWTRDHEGGKTNAGLKFLHGRELDKLVDDWPRRARPQALVLVEDPRTRALVRRVLQAAQYEGTFPDSSTALDSSAIARYSVIMMGASSTHSDIVRCMRESTGQELPRLILINDQADRGQVLETLSHSRFEHLVGDLDSEKVLFSTLSKLLVGDFFGLTKYLMWGAEPKSWSIAAVPEKPEVLAGVRQVAEAVGCHPRVADLLIAAVDEMIINALTHSGSHGDTPVIVEAASDSRLLGVAVLDAHGRLSPENVFASLDKALGYQREGVPVNPERMSLGFWIMLNTLSHLAINVEPGQRTEIIGIIDLEKTLRELRKAVPSLGMFSRR